MVEKRVENIEEIRAYIEVHAKLTGGWVMGLIRHLV
jgi:hypothetical protein